MSDGAREEGTGSGGEGKEERPSLPQDAPLQPGQNISRREMNYSSARRFSPQLPLAVFCSSDSLALRAKSLHINCESARARDYLYKLGYQYTASYEN